MSPRRNHVVVCGLGRVGRRVVDLFERLGEPVVVVSQQPCASRPDLVVGDARDDAVLRAAGVEAARAVVVVTGHDMTNVSIALDARRLAPDATIVIRLFDQDLGAHLEASLGIRRALSTSALAAPAFTSAALGQSVLAAFEVGGSRWVMDEADPERGVVLRAATRPVGAPGGSRGRMLLRGLHDWWRETPRLLRLSLVSLILVVVLSVAVFHVGLGLPVVDAYYFVITTVSTTGYGDINLQNASPLLKVYGTLVMLAGAALIAVLYSLLTDLLLRTRLRDVVLRGAAHQEGHVVVAGLGSIGLRVVRELVANGEHVVAVEQSEGSPFLEAARELAPVVIGDAKAEETLRKVGVTRARAMVAATDDDLANLSIALATTRLSPDCHVVLRLFDADLATKLRGSLDVDAVLSVSGSAAPTLVGAALHDHVLRGLVVRDALLLLVHRVVGAAEPQHANEQLLLLKRAGQAQFRQAAPDAAPAVGDEIVAARWCRFTEAAGLRELPR